MQKISTTDRNNDCNRLALAAHALAVATENMLRDESFKNIFAFSAMSGLVYNGEMINVPLANLKHELIKFLPENPQKPLKPNPSLVR